MKLLVRFLSSSLGKKYLMGLTGFVLYLFVIFHMLGNLQIFLGQEAVNRYANFLKSLPELLWLARIGLLLAAIVHVVVAVQLVIENRRARGVNYKEKKSLCATLASRTMALSGVIVLGFIIYHIAHFTLGVTNPEFFHFRDHLGRHDVYNMMVYSFQMPYISILYIVGVGLLCFHLSHGIQSVFHSLGLIKNSYDQPLRWFSWIFSFLLFVGMSSMPVAVLLGVIKPSLPLIVL